MLVLFIALLQKDAANQDTAGEVADIMTVRSFYQVGAELPETARGPAPIVAAKKACRIIDQLLASRSHHATKGQDAARAATALFRHVSDVVNTMPSRASSPHREAEASIFNEANQIQGAFRRPDDLLANLQTTFPTLALFGQNGLHAEPHVNTFDTEASRHALMSLSRVEVPPDNIANPFGVGILDFADFFENYDTSI